MSNSQYLSIGAAALALIGATLLAVTGQISWATAIPVDLAALGILGIHPNLPSQQ